MENKEIIDEIKLFLKNNGIGFIYVYLFGSRSRSDYNKNSDFDILIVLDCNIDSEQRRKLSIKIKHYLVHKNILLNIDLIIKNLENWNWESENIGFLSHTVKEEGALL